MKPIGLTAVQLFRDNPALNPFERKFWAIFWKIYERERKAGEKSGAAEVLKA